MSSAPKGVVETGAPSFVVMGPEEIGLSLAPTDLHVLPDGRVLVVSQRELAFGDGVRWDTFRSLDGEPPIISMVAVDGDGQIYTGLNGGFARIDLGDGGRWHFTQVAMASQIPDAGSLDLTRVAVISDQWYWYGGTKEIVSWRPGQPVTIRGTVDSPDRIFNLGKDVFLSQGNSGELVRLKGNGGIERIRAADILVSETVTCTIPFGDGQLLAGTGSVGKAGGNIRDLGFVADEALLVLTKNAVALMCLSKYEGFGIPVAEAMAAGTVAVAAKNASLPEVAGDAGILVDDDRPVQSRKFLFHWVRLHAPKRIYCQR